MATEDSIFSLYPPPGFTEALIPEESEPYDSNLLFLMGCSGFFRDNGDWKYSPISLKDIEDSDEFRALQTKFFGPVMSSPFFKPKDFHIGDATKAEYVKEVSVASLDQPSVKDLVSKLRESDPKLAVKIGFMLGGFIRTLIARGEYREDIPPKVNFLAEMGHLSGPRAIEATIAAMAMYVLDDGSVEEDAIAEPGEDGESFQEKVLRMAQAIEADPIIPTQTRHLGLSQLARLFHYTASYNSSTQREQEALKQSVVEFLRPFIDYPTVGAEFHLDPDRVDNTVLQQAAILNMSQFYPGSSVQFSRRDHSTFEVRVDPSDFATFQSLWGYLRKVFTPLGTTNYTVTLRKQDRDFSWNNEDRGLLEKIHGLSLLIHSAFYSTLPKKIRKSAGHNVGDMYLGQTDALVNSKYRFSGNWSGGRGESGQVGLSVGYGPEMFGALTYYLSMFLAKPDLFSSLRVGNRSLGDIRTLTDALKIAMNTPSDITSLYEEMDKIIAADTDLRMAYIMGNRIRRAFKLEGFSF